MAIAKKLTASAIASSLLLAITGPAFAADLTVDAVAQKMFDLGIVKGNGTDLNLGGTLTRAELVTTIVRSFGLEQAALLSKGAPSFADVSATEWYSGWVAVAKNLAEQKGVALGVGNNSFNPNGQLSKVEALVFVMKFLGITPSTTTSVWYEAWINEAVARGIITAEQGADVAATGTTPSTRGEAFIILDRGYSFKGANGESLYTTYADAIDPVLNLTVAQTTTEAAIVLSGSATDNKAIASVVINGEAVALTNGAFSKEIALNVGANQIAVVVTDLAGNVVTKTYEVVRGNVDAEAIEAADFTVVAGATANVEAKLVDKNGEAIANAVITGESTVGTFANGVFTAGTAAGTGTLTLKSGEITKTVNVTVAAGELAQVQAASVEPKAITALNATDAYGNKIEGATWSVKTAGAFIDPAGNFYAAEAGTYTVVATKGGITVEGTVGVYDATVAGYKVTAPAEAVGNGETKYAVTVQATDLNGNIIPGADEAAVAISTAFTPVDKDGNAITTVDIVDGKGTFYVIANDALVGESISIDLGGDLGTTSVNVVAQVATSVKVNAAEDYLLTNSGLDDVTVTVDVLDQAGAPMLDGEWEIALSVSGPAKLYNGNTVVTSLTWNPVANNTFTLKANEIAATGAITISATTEGLTAGSDAVTAAVAQEAAKIVLTAGEDTDVVANNAVEYAIQLTDKNGVPSDEDATVRVTVTGFTQDDVDANFDLTAIGATPVEGTVNQFDVTVTGGAAAFTLTSTKAGTFTVQAKDAAETPALTTSGTSAFTVAAGDAAELTTTSFTTLKVLRGAENTVNYQLVDAYGNLVAKKDVKVTLTAAAGALVNGKSTVDVLTDANGVATAKVVSTLMDGTFAITAESEGLTAAAPVTLTAVPQIAGSVTASVLHEDLTAYSHALTAGDAIVLKAAVKDQEGFAMPATGAGALDSADFKVLSGTTEITGVTWTLEADGYYYSTPIDVTKAGSTNFTVVMQNIATEVKASTRNISVVAGDLAGVKIVGANETNDITVEAGKVNTLTVQLVDTYGNIVKGSANAAGVTVTFSDNLSGTEWASFRDADGNELVEGIEIAVNKVTGVFYLVTNTDKAGDTITLTVEGLGSFTFNLK